MQQKIILKAAVPESSEIHDKFIPVPDYVIPYQDLEMIQSLECSKGKPSRILVGKFQHYQILFIDPLLNQLKNPCRKFLEN